MIEEETERTEEARATSSAVRGIGDPGLKGRSVRPYDLRDRLPHIPRALYEAHLRIQQTFPHAITEQDFIKRISQVISRYARSDLDLWLHRIEAMRRVQLKSVIPGTTFIAVIGLPPQNQKILVEADLRFVYRIVYQLLGGSTQKVDMQRPLSEIEQGVFSFVGLKLLEILQEDFVLPEQFALRLEDMRSSLEDVADILRYEDDWTVFTYKANLDLEAGYFRILFPASLLQEAAPQSPPAGSPFAKRVEKLIWSRTGRLKDVTFDAPVVAGQLELEARDIETLEVGDIALLENSEIVLDGENISGRARMQIGTNPVSFATGFLGPDEEAPSVHLLQVEELNVGASPPDQLQSQEPKEAMVEDALAKATADEKQGYEGQEDALEEDYGTVDENEGEEEVYEDPEAEVTDDEHYEPVSSESRALLQELTVSISVEVGRARMTAEDVLRLSPGHVLELGRSPNDPVDLVVGNRRIAKGQLVEIDGSLGVKILSITGE